MHRRGLLVCASLGLSACYALGPYVCGSDASCVDGANSGVCQDSGYCSYPDATCASGQRYDDLAGDGLAGACVADAETTGVAADSTSGGESDTADVADGSGSDGPQCRDEDGDGYGEGAGCLGVDCDDDNPMTHDSCLYVAPDGDDAAAGTADAPWLTFGRAVAALTPGRSLIVGDGEYVPDVHGTLQADCRGGPAVSGTPDAPIFVRAATDRRAHIATGGADNGVALRACAHWRIRGLVVSSADNPVFDGNSVVSVSLGEQIVLRHMLAHTNNRYAAAPIFTISDSIDTLVEDAEAYNFSTTAYWSTSSVASVFRRVYAHSWDRPDHPDCVDAPTGGEPKCAQYPDLGDHGVVAGDATLVENAVIEQASFGVVGGSARANATVLGSAFVGGLHAVIFSTDGDRPEGHLVRVSDVVSIGSQSRTIYLRSVPAADLQHVTSVDAGGGVLRLDRINDVVCPGGCQTTAVHLLSVGSEGDGVSMYDDNVGSVRHSNATGSMALDFRPDDDEISDDEGFYRQSTTLPTPRIGGGATQCVAYVPADSAMAGAGENGADIGANVLYRIQDGVTTDAPLWDPVTGQFPCGPVVEGVNDDPAVSCIGVHARLHVATDGCPLPDDYPSPP